MLCLRCAAPLRARHSVLHLICVCPVDLCAGYRHSAVGIVSHDNFLEEAPPCVLEWLFFSYSGTDVIPLESTSLSCPLSQRTPNLSLSHQPATL